jgi:hypothetical protein
VSALGETAAALARFAALDFKGWEGLPSCTLADVEAVWRAAEAPARELLLGTAFEPTEARYFDTGSRWVRVWSRGHAVVELDVDGPLELDVPALAEPESRLTAHSGFASYRDGEHVHASRGFALGLAPESGVVLYAAVFAPCSVGEYAARFRIDREQRPILAGGGPRVR